MPTECKFTALPFLRKFFEDIKYIFLPYLIDFTSIYNTNYKNTFSKERFTDLNSLKKKQFNAEKRSNKWNAYCMNAKL